MQIAGTRTAGVFTGSLITNPSKVDTFLRMKEYHSEIKKNWVVLLSHDVRVYKCLTKNLVRQLILIKPSSEFPKSAVVRFEDRF